MRARKEKKREKSYILSRFAFPRGAPRLQRSPSAGWQAGRQAGKQTGRQAGWLTIRAHPLPTYVSHKSLILLCFLAHSNVDLDSETRLRARGSLETYANARPTISYLLVYTSAAVCLRPASNQNGESDDDSERPANIAIRCSKR